MSCQSNRKTSYAVGIGINLSFAAILIAIAFFGRMNDASLIAIMGGVIAMNTVLFAGTGSSGRCWFFRSRSST